MRLYTRKNLRYLLAIIICITLTSTVLLMYRTRNGMIFESSNSTKHSTPIIENHDLFEEVSKDEKYSREITDNSPFQYILKKVFEKSDPDNPTAINEGYSKIILEKQWKDLSAVSQKEQCQILVDAIYAENEDWSNDKIFNLANNDKNLHPLISEYSERLRIFYHCFLFNDVKLPDVFDVDSSRTALDFQHKMFPFLKFPKQDEPLLPKVTNLTSMEPVPFILKQSVKDHNENFWSNWAQMSHGRGIVTTFPEADSGYFFKLLNVLQHLNNTMPIQIVVNEDDLSDDCIRQLSQKGKETQQELYVITFSNLLDGKNKDHIKGFMNKLLASLFNTFEEYIFIDGDVIPFITPEEFFDFDEYKTSGLYITRDREVPYYFNKDCAEAFTQAEPTKEEVNIINTSLKYTITTMHSRTKTAEATSLYFKEHFMHVSESGLMMINKRKNLAGTLTALMLMLNPKLASCSQGDKEFYWFGQLYSGLDYEFEPEGAVLMGFPIKEYNDKECYTKTTLRDNHIGHTHKEKLVWVNGGMTRFKQKRTHESKYKNPPMRMNGWLMPDRKYGLWTFVENHLGPAHKAFAIEAGGMEKPHGLVKWFDQDEYDYYDTISKVWNEVKDEK